MPTSSNNLKRKLSVTADVNEVKDKDSFLEQSPDPAVSSEKKVNDDDLVFAAEALTSLNRSVTPPPSFDSAMNSPKQNGDNNQNQIMEEGENSSDVEMEEKTEEKSVKSEHPLVTQVTKVSKHPLVTNAVKYYENSKKNYAKFNYAAEIVEKAAIPVVNKIEVNLNNRHQASQLKKEATAAAARKKRRVVTSDNVSMETKKRIYFCLHILRLANENISNKVTALQTKIDDKEKEIKELRQNSIQSLDLEISNPNEEVQQTKTEIVGTVKKIIHLISNFKPSSLSSQSLTPVSSHLAVESDVETDPEALELKLTIRDIILRLPSKIQQCSISTGTSEQTNDKILLFARESLEMISKLTNVFNNQLLKAEDWVGGEEEEAEAEDSDSNSTLVPEDSNELRKRETNNSLQRHFSVA